MLFGIIFIGVIVAIAVIYNACMTTNVNVKGGVPYCPICNRQVTMRRDYCRSCGYKFRTFGSPSQPVASPVVAPARPEPPPILIPKTHWERLHNDPNDFLAHHQLLSSLEKEIKERLMGPKVVSQDVLAKKVVMRRSRLQYESTVGIFFGDERHGFDVEVPVHGFKIRITCPRVVPPDVIGAPWDDLLANLCKIDRSVIKSRNSKSQPLTYTPKQGPHPMLRVEVLSRKALPN